MQKLLSLKALRSAVASAHLYTIEVWGIARPF